MNIKTAVFAALLTVSVGFAQTPAPQSQTFDFTNKQSPQGLQEVATILRTVGDIKQLSIDATASTVTVQGTTDQLAMSGWIVHSLDQPDSTSANPPAQPFLMPGTSDDLIRIFHLANTKTPQGIQEILTVLRTVADVQKIFNYTPLADLVVRGPAAQINLTAYLINALDVVPGSVTTSNEFLFQAPPQGNQVARVFYLANAKTLQQTQEILTVLRTVVDIQKIFNVNAPNALAIRGTAGDIATSEWIIQSLDIPAAAKPGPSAVRQFIMPTNAPGGNIVRVFYPPHITTPQALQQTLTLLRTKVQLQRIFNYTGLWALVVRGTADQITKAEQLILEQDQVAKSVP